MNSRPRLPVFSLLSLLVCCSLCGPLWATGERTAAGPRTEPLTAQNSAGLRQAAEPVQAAGPQSYANETSSLFPVVERGRWGYIDKTGRIVIPPQYDSADPFFEGLAQVWIGGKVGYIDTTGQIVIAPLYDPHVGTSLGFSEDRARARVSEKIGYIDKTGKMVIPPQYEAAEGFSEGLAAVRVGDKWGYINKAGEMVIPSQYEVAAVFSEGLAEVKVGDKWGYIDASPVLLLLLCSLLSRPMPADHSPEMTRPKPRPLCPVPAVVLSAVQARTLARFLWLFQTSSHYCSC